MSDKKYLIQVSIGPVQSFSAAARRTRDFWYGSHLLSEISGKVAGVLAGAGTGSGNLLIPAKATDKNVPNVILARVETEDPAGVVEECRRAAQDAWLEKVKEIREKHQAVIEETVWESQKEDVIEFYGAWVPLNGDFRGARANLARLLAGRKQVRDFVPAQGFPKKPKSSLDAARESVLREKVSRRDYNRTLRKGRVRGRIDKGNWTPSEQLDVVGMVKRFAGDTQQYPSVARIAADPWLRGLPENVRQGLIDRIEDLKNEASGEEDTKYDVVSLRRDAFPQFETFPYEGTIVYPSRLKEVAEDPDAKMEGKLLDFKQYLESLTKEHREPSPYYAILRADGDRMGKVLGLLSSEEEIRRFSDKLADFSKSVERIIRDHYGCLVYAGGDDVLAFVPLDQCLECASELQEEFKTKLEEFASPNGPTLSVGIAVAHFMEPMSVALEWSQEAEKDAKKPNRNGLAIHYHTRGGSPVKIRDQWSQNIVGRLDFWMERFQDRRLPDKAAYEIREMAKSYKNWKESSKAREALTKDLHRLIERKRTQEGKKVDEEVTKKLKEKFEEFLNRFEQSPNDAALALARELIIARQLAQARDLAAGRNQTGEEEGENNA